MVCNLRNWIPANTYVAIEARRNGYFSRRVKNMYRYQNRLMANITASPQYKFVPVMKLKSQGRVDFECPDKLYTDNYRRCYSLRGAFGRPQLAYKLRTTTGRGRCQYYGNICIQRAGMANPNLPPCDLRLILTSLSQLEVRDESDGRLMYALNLASPDSPQVRYQEMQWDPNHDQIIVTSTRALRDILCYILIIEYCPVVRLSLRIPIRKSVFGGNVKDVLLFDNVLRTSTKEGTIRLYDFERIKEMNEIVNGVTDPVLKLLELPSPLLRVEKANGSMVIGGYPWMYMTRVKDTDTFSIRTLNHKEIQSLPPNNSWDFDSLRFHQEDDRIIVVNTLNSVKYFMLNRHKDPNPLEEVRAFRLAPGTWQAPSDESGDHSYSVGNDRSHLRRSAARRTVSYAETQMLFAEDYENELNIVTLLGIPENVRGDLASLQMFDNDTGECIRTMNFAATLSSMYQYSVTLDLDVLVLTVHSSSQKAVTQVYRLVYDDESLSKKDRAPDSYPILMPQAFEDMEFEI